MKREQWEYCELRQEIAQGILHDQYILFYGVDESTRRESVTNRDVAIARLGLEGWEMVTTVGGFNEDSSGFRMFFKRRIE
jgi:hypothetical protein